MKVKIIVKLLILVLLVCEGCSSDHNKMSNNKKSIPVSFQQDSKNKNDSPNPVIKQTTIKRPVLHTVNVTEDLNSYFLNNHWVAHQELDLYSDDTFEKIVSLVKKNDKFKILDAKYNFHHCMKVKITNILENDFDECDYPFNVGDEISLLYTMGECEWVILYKGEENFASFSWEIDKGKVTESVYDGCHKIEGDIIKSTESFTLIMKIINLTTNKIGYVRMIHDGAGVWDKFQPNFD